VYVLAIDQGTSSTKSIVFNEAAQPVASGTAPLHTTYTADGRAEQDPEDIYRSTIESISACIRTLEAKAGVRRDEIECAGIANQRETFVLWDSDGTPLHNAVVWQCKRSVEICSELKAGGAEDEIRNRSGLIIDPYFSGTKLTWLMRNSRSIRAAHDAGQALFGTVDSWLLYRLTGGAVHATDHTNASRTLLFNIHTLAWDDELSRILEVPSLRLPTVHPSSYHYGDSDFGGLFSTKIPIRAMIGDSHSALFGERCYTPGSAKATLGTGSSILINAGATAPKLSPSAMSTIGFSLPDRVDYALEGIIVSAGSVLTWLGKELGFFDDGSELDAVSGEVADSGGVCVVPGHAGLGAPFWRMDAKGSVTGLTFATTKTHILRAALESIPYQIRAILDAIANESAVRCRSIKADGGISRNEFVISWLADTLGLPVHTFATADVTALGAGLLAGLGAGVYDSVAAIKELPLGDRETAPGNDRAAAEHGYNLWRAQVDLSVGAAKGAV
jgi:glycerol kinase